MKTDGRYLGRNLGRYLAVGTIVLLVVLAAVLLSAGSWLESESGRNLLQRELSKALGLGAEFRGKYSLRLFPVIRITGRDLSLNDAATGLTIVSVDSYELHLALRPLLRKEVDILEVAIHDGVLDLDRLAEFNSARTEDVSSDVQLPGIRVLEITGLKLQKSAVDFLMLSKLNLDNFAENQKSRFSLELALDQNEAATGQVHLEGDLQVTANPLKLKLLVEELLLQQSEQHWSVGQGELNWSANRNEFSGELHGVVAAYSSRYLFSVQMADALQIALSIDLQIADEEPFAIQLKARDESGRWLLEMMELNLDGQKLGGTGCFSTNADPLLQLQLEAQELDLDALQQLIPAGLLPVNPGAEIGAAKSQDAEFPVQLAVALSAGQLNWSGATAHNVRLLIGAEPDCSSSEVLAPQKP